MFLTRLLTTLAHLYNLVGWLKMLNPPPPPHASTHRSEEALEQPSLCCIARMFTVVLIDWHH